MDHHKRSLRAGAAAILCALCFRLLAGGTGLQQVFRSPRLQSFLIYLETGRLVRFSPSSTENTAASLPAPEPETCLPAEPTETELSHTEPPFQPQTEIPSQLQTEPPEPMPEPLPCFRAEDAAAVGMFYNVEDRPDLGSLMEQGLDWDLRGELPAVLIVHTHTTESYQKQPGDSYTETAAFRTLDREQSVVAVGDRVAQRLEEAGIRVIHDREYHDYPSYNGSYTRTRASTREYLEQYPSVQLVLDIHRDASGDIHNQMRPVLETEAGPVARMMLVIGTGSSGRTHPGWQQNLSLALKLHTQLERETPGIMRPLVLRSSRFNQDLLPGALLVEMGAAGNSREEALRAAELLAQGIIALSRGTDPGVI